MPRAVTLEFLLLENLRLLDLTVEFCIRTSSVMSFEPTVYHKAGWPVLNLRQGSCPEPTA